MASQPLRRRPGVVFAHGHTDYRGHAGSSPIPEGTEEDESRLGYTRDTINAVQAMKRLPYVDPDRTALLGRSMGGGMVTYASVSSDIVDNINRWAVPSRPEEVARLYRQMHHGTNDESCPIRWAYTTRDLLETAGVRQRLWVYPGEQHAFGPQWDLSIRRVIGFLDRHLA